MLVAQLFTQGQVSFSEWSPGYLVVGSLARWDSQKNMHGILDTNTALDNQVCIFFKNLWGAIFMNSLFES